MRFMRQKKIAPRIPSNSMADIAFLLLIFFLVNTTVERDRGITMTLPPKGMVKQVAVENIARIEIDPSGKVYFNEQIVPIDHLAALATDLQVKNPQIIFSIQPSKSASYKDYIAVLDQLRKAQVARIAINESTRF